MRRNRYEITGQGQVDVAELPLIGEQEPVGGFLLAECPINEIERFDVVQGYAAEWRKAFALIPQDLGPSENLALAKKFGPTAKQHEAAIAATITEIRSRRIEIMRPAPDKLAVAETLDRAEKVLDGLLAEIKAARKDTEDRVKDEMERRKLEAVQSSLGRIGAARIDLFTGPLSAVPLQDPSARLRNAGKGKKTPETCIAAIHAEADLIIAERTALAALCRTNLDLINAADLPAVSAVAESLMMKPTAEVQAVIARRLAEAEAAEAKKQATLQREPEKLAALKAEVQKMANLHHMSNWERRHKSDLAHPDDQAELWQFFGAHHDRVESRNKPPHPADAHQAAPQGSPAQHPEPARQPAAVQQPLPSPQPAAPEPEREVAPTLKMELSKAEAGMVVGDNHVDWSCEEKEIADTGRWTVTTSAVMKHIPTDTYWSFCYRRAATEMQCVEPFEGDPEPICPQQVKQVNQVVSVWVDADYVAAAETARPAETAPPAAPMATERPEGMPETDFAFAMKFHCGKLDEEGVQRLYGQICDVVEAAGGEVFEARKI